MKKPLCFLLLLTAMGCVKKEMTPGELKAFISDSSNGLRKEASANGFTLNVTYRPEDLLVVQHLGSTETTQVLIDSIRNKYNRSWYFTVSISKGNNEALQFENTGDQYSEVLQNMSFRMNQYVKLIADQDTIQVADFVLERTYGRGTSTNLLFAFDRKQTANPKAIHFNINEFGLGLGNQQFRFETSDLYTTPKIKFTSKN